MSRVELYRETVRRPVTGDEVERGITFTVSQWRGFPGKWRWRFVSNGHVMADSGQGYSRRVDALTGCATVLGARFVRAGEHPDTFVGWMIRDKTVWVHDLTREAKP